MDRLTPAGLSTKMRNLAATGDNRARADERTRPADALRMVTRVITVGPLML